MGFYCINIFQSSVIYPNLKELLNNNILKEEELCDVSHSRKEKKMNSEYYGAFIKNKIYESDFIKLNFEALKSKISEYWQDVNWGSDLPIFKKNFDLALSDLRDFDLNNKEYYYIEIEELNPDKIIDPNFFVYLVCVISIEEKSNKIITLTFGLD